MPDPKHTVDGIRAFLGSGNATAGAQIRNLATDYLDMCREANLRLKRCAEFLRDGLRGEAVAHARARPELLEFITGLQFSELPEWERACGSLNLPKPSRLATETAQHLVEAVRQQEPLEELLAKHRYLALARAEPSQRLAVLRQLIAADPTSPCWKRDAEELESARLAALHTDAAAAARKGDIVTVHTLLAELNAGPWVTPIPADLKEILTKASASLSEAATAARLRALLPRVRAAESALSYEECRAVFQEWGAIVKESKITVPPDLRGEILPLAHWLDEEEDRRQKEREFKAACATLTAAIEGRRPIEQLTRLYRAAVGFDLPMPERLLLAYRRVLETARQEQRREKRKQYLLAALLIGVIGVALAVLAYVMFGMGH
ncbi:MAG TPA: hypothetical protein VFE47_13880 [Tepidisphaeraceae bacterium]|jgi:hypothetical protein|nr:hypothetical protein [Tepidisphaeraceae bacterium]